MEQIYYADGVKKQKTREMYQKIFTEDSPGFVDYYYEWKTRENRVLVMEEDGKQQGMLHQNPYCLQIFDDQAVCDYIVAVATCPQYRRQGKMQRLMKAALEEMYRKEQPFTFLLPADPAYYQGQGFVYTPIRPEHISGIGALDLNGEKIEGRAACEKDYEEMAEFSNRTLKEQKDIFVVRTPSYYRRLAAETASESGGVVLLTEESGIAGILAYGTEAQEESKKSRKKKETGVSVKELILLEKYQIHAEEICRRVLGTEQITWEPMHMMVRITNLQRLCGMLRSNTPMQLKIMLWDEMIPEQSGSYEICIGDTESSIRRIPKEEAEREMEAAELAKELFKDTEFFIQEWV